MVITIILGFDQTIAYDLTKQVVTIECHSGGLKFNLYKINK